MTPPLSSPKPFQPDGNAQAHRGFFFSFFFFNPFTLLFPPLDRQLALPDRPCSCAIQTPHSTPSEGNAWVSTHACWEPETPLPPQTSPVRWVLKDHATVRLAQSKAHASEQACGPASARTGEEPTHKHVSENLPSEVVCSLPNRCLNRTRLLSGGRLFRSRLWSDCYRLGLAELYYSCAGVAFESQTSRVPATILFKP